MHFVFISLILGLVGTRTMAFGEDAIRVDLQMENVFFRNGSSIVHAFVYKPQGKGKFPAIIYNQATRDPYYAPEGIYPFESLARWANTNGCVLFIPDRPGHELSGKSLGEFADLLEDKT